MYRTKQRISFDKIVRGLFFVLLFNPIWGYIYTEIFFLPKTIVMLWYFVFFILGFFFLFKRNLKIHGFVLLYFLFTVYKFVWNVDILIDKDIQTLTKIWYFIADFAIVAMLIIIYNTTYTKKFIKNSKKIIFITLLLAAIVSVIQVFDMSFFNHYDKEFLEKQSMYSFRRTSIFSYIHPLSLGYDGLPLLAVILGVYLLNKDKKYVYMFIAGGIIAFLSNTRAVILVYLFLYLMLYIYFKRNRLKYTLYMVATLLVFYFFLKYVIGYDFVQWYNERLLSEGSLDQTTRYKAIGNFKNFFPQHPWFGFGEQTAEIKKASRLVGSSHIHVGYLSHLVNYGIVGCTFLYGAWLSILRKLYKTAKLTNYWGSFFAFFCLLIAFATHSGSSIFFYGFMFAFIFDKYYYDTYMENQKENIQT